MAYGFNEQRQFGTLEYSLELSYKLERKSLLATIVTEFHNQRGKPCKVKKGCRAWQQSRRTPIRQITKRRGFFDASDFLIPGLSHV